jgi:hypothetical protein
MLLCWELPLLQYIIDNGMTTADLIKLLFAHEAKRSDSLEAVNAADLSI